MIDKPPSSRAERQTMNLKSKIKRSMEIRKLRAELRQFETFSREKAKRAESLILEIERFTLIADPRNIDDCNATEKFKAEAEVVYQDGIRAVTRAKKAAARLSELTGIPNYFEVINHG